jgi:hypothetical protein
MRDDIDWPVLGTLAKENDTLRSIIAAKDAAIARLREELDAAHALLRYMSDVENPDLRARIAAELGDKP